ncbi:serine/threonine-protein kinase [Cellulosimicrobium protaetiae]|uniref:non-specific serine/threonine protein kinase n=1 Tax=Cellulosimicrobium protaetiae TaxID=2587808 RepID=A0A6M5UDC4_9MICO|nr:serine/threonine-protein kinase [Cellulosimicrobium protaetiae]QJW35173.1 protein kinase [Cellulosimicrobium protaetiae]
MKPVRGLTLGNRYRLVRRIAVGGMGEVWVAADDALGREVAVKVLRSEYAGNEDFLNRLRTEARNSAALSHPNIAQMYDYGEANGSGYLVMELVVGEPMADLLEREPVLPPARLLPILAQTARGLHAAHLSAVVHRDVKPGNILIDRAGTVKITDFGVSLAANQVPMTATGMVMGTAQYLSPEQAVGQAATGASDIYALGIVAYESLVGNRPFTGSTPVDIAVAHVNEPVPPLPSSVDRELAELVMVMLAKDPLARPHPADALARVFEEIQARLAADPWSSRSGASANTRRARRARATADEAPVPEPDPAPVITPLVIPAAVRDPHPADPATPWVAPPAAPGDGAADPAAGYHDDPGAPGDQPAPDAATAHGPALPWERPVPGGASPDDAAGPRAYPPRREMHGGTRSSRRPQPARGGARPAGRPAAPVPPAPATTRAEARRQSQATPSRSSGGRRTSTTTGRRLGGLPNGLTWPLVALLGLLLVLVIATVASLGDRGTDDGAAAAPDAVTSAHPVGASGPATGATPARTPSERVTS